jgi:RimJ/RimL family protein N-acetyltransferase
VTHGETDAVLRELVLRRATAGDARVLWEWANDLDVRRQSFSPDPILWEQHVRWLAARLDSADCAIWILERSGQPLGQVRYERDKDDTATIDFSVAAYARREGIGALLLSRSAPEAVAALGVATLLGVVKKDNVASARAFERAGFVDEGDISVGAWSCRRFALRMK